MTKPILISFLTILSCLLVYPSFGASDLKLGEERVPESEAEAIRGTDAMMEDFMAKQYAGAQVTKRAIHPKMHGIVRATVIVNNNLPDWAKAGMFQEGAQYKAWIRLSNASSFKQPDSKGDARGFAMKVLDVKGPRILAEDAEGHNQDFTVNSFPVFFAKDAASYMAFIKSFFSTKNFLQYVFPSKNPLTWRLRELKILIKSGFVKASSPLNMNYYSMSPFRHGPDQSVAVKYRVSPIGGVKKVSFDDSDENYLGKTLARELSEGDVGFTFSIQRQVNAEEMPIEDPTVRWDESVSPFVPVATIIIPRQTFDSPEQIAFGENLTFNPWRGLADHRPLGGINRLRLCNYILSAKIRHAANKAPEKEPAVDGSF